MNTMTASSTDIAMIAPQARVKSDNITIRRTKFKSLDLNKQYTKSALMSHLLTALSASFPQGEHFFVETVRNVREQISDPQLQADISAFIGQESMHARAHDQFNEQIQSNTYHLKKFDALFAQEMIRLRTLSPRRQLAATVALEHFTAMIAGYLLKHPRLIQQLPENMASLWIWHAVEEIEHKHVAFDVYQSIFANLAQRRRSMRTITIGFLTSNAMMTGHLLWQDRKHSLGNIKQLWLNVRDLGLLTHMVLSLLPEYLAFYREGFHPAQIDQTRLLTHWRRDLMVRALVEDGNLAVSA